MADLEELDIEDITNKSTFPSDEDEPDVNSELDDSDDEDNDDDDDDIKNTFKQDDNDDDDDDIKNTFKQDDDDDDEKYSYSSNDGSELSEEPYEYSDED